MHNAYTQICRYHSQYSGWSFGAHALMRGNSRLFPDTRDAAVRKIVIPRPCRHHEWLIRKVLQTNRESMGKPVLAVECDHPLTVLIVFFERSVCHVDMGLDCGGCRFLVSTHRECGRVSLYVCLKCCDWRSWRGRRRRPSSLRGTPLLRPRRFATKPDELSQPLPSY